MVVKIDLTKLSDKALEDRIRYDLQTYRKLIHTKEQEKDYPGLIQQLQQLGHEYLNRHGTPYTQRVMHSEMYKPNK